MPSIDTDTFQIVTLGLLGLIAIIELISLVSLSGIKKRLGPAGEVDARSEEEPGSDMAETSPPLGVEVAGESPATEVSVQPAEAEPIQAQPAEAQPIHTEQPASIDLDEVAAAARGEEQVASYGRSEEPSAQQQLEQAQAATTAAQQTPQEDPQEQPFERDGRWWFRRGDELLVYEERTGQWVPAPGSGTSSSAPEPAAEAVAGGSAGEQTVADEAPSSFWKCPTCGAVNGATALSCRMCFTQRPAGT